MLVVSGLTKRFADQTVFADFSFTVPPNGVTVLLGPSGCGKSTLFDVLTGVVPGDGGTISWCGKELTHLGRSAAYMQQKDLLLPWFTLMENALLPARIGGSDLAGARRRAGRLFKRLGLAGFEDFRPSKVSGGMRQRCALVRTLMFDHDLVLLDEPLSALDAITRQSLQSLLLLLQSEFGKSLLMITHDIEEALLLADTLLVVSPMPMQVGEQFVLSQPKPRSVSDPELLRLKEHVWERLQGDMDHG
ncbi:MAG: ABC transporter ATP-binding protein [Desulfobacterales bacterium]|nr:ABC transporter ATP-binding protein [Desulfobacterales bacterium]